MQNRLSSNPVFQLLSMKNFRKKILVVCLLFSCSKVFSNDSAFITFEFSASLNLKRFNIRLSDGINDYSILPATDKFWGGALFAPYGVINIGYRDSDTSMVETRFFFKKGTVKLHIVPLHESKKYYAIDESASVNVMSYEVLNGNLLDSFVKKEAYAANDFVRKNRTKIGVDPDITRRGSILFDSLRNKKIQFIQQYPELYLSFWTFQQDVVKSGIIKPDSLLKLYNSLSEQYKKTKAGTYLSSVIFNKLAISSKAPFPDFSVKDTKGNQIELSQLKGKYVLVQFWASWCVPCIKEIPILKEIEKKYRNSPFILISFSIDKDSQAFQKAIEKYSMTWPQVYGRSPSL